MTLLTCWCDQTGQESEDLGMSQREAPGGLDSGFAASLVISEKPPGLLKQI